MGSVCTAHVDCFDPARLWLTLGRYVSVTSPVVLPATVVEALEGLELSDLPRLVAELAQRYPVRRIEAPPLGRRVLGEDDLAVLAALSESAGNPEPDADPGGDPRDDVGTELA